MYVRGGNAFRFIQTNSNGNIGSMQMPGGAAGIINGRDGNNGITGSSGSDGKSGTVSYFVVHSGGVLESYSRLYHLSLIYYQNFCSNTGIIEPGQEVRICGFRLINDGGVPLPSGLLEMYVAGGEVIQQVFI